MSEVSLVDRARADAAVTALGPDEQRGAEAYFQAYEYVEGGNPPMRQSRLRRMAAAYLAFTADPPLTSEQNRAAKLARTTLKRLSRRHGRHAA